VKKFHGGREGLEEAAMAGALALLDACGGAPLDAILLGSAHPYEFGGLTGPDLAERTAATLRARGAAVPVEFFSRPGVYVPEAALAASANGADLLHEAALRVARGERRAIGVLALEQMRLRETAETTAILRSLIHEEERRYGLTMPALGALLEAYAVTRVQGLDRALRELIFQNRRNAMANPRAHVRKALSAEDYETEKNPVVSDPLRLWGVAPVSSGYAALRVACEPSGERAVRVVGFGQGLDRVSVAARARFLRSRATAQAMANLDACLGRPFSEVRGDVRYAEIHDAFPIIEYQGLVDTGLLDEATAVRDILAGATAPGARIPVNLSGGVMAGHPVGATGVGQIVELAIEGLGLSEKARSWPLPHYALALNVGGPATYNCVTLLRVETPGDSAPPATIDLPRRFERADFDLTFPNGNLPAREGRVISATRLFYPPPGYPSPTEVVFVELPDRRVFAAPDEPGIATGEAVVVAERDGLYRARRAIDAPRPPS
jgi:acetyl-CoA acetyltransferase